MFVSKWLLRPESTTGYLRVHPSMCENGRGILSRAGRQNRAMFEVVYFIPGKEAGAE
jgi:hypothetical protein